MIFKIYKLLLKWYSADEYVKEAMIKWSFNTNVEIEMEQGKRLWKKSLKITSCTTLQENCYKLLYRWYITPKKLSKMYKKHVEYMQKTRRIYVSHIVNV